MTNVKAADTTLFHKLSILIAGILWGCMGLFVRPLDALGLSSWDIVFLRACLTTLFMLLLILLKNPGLLRIRLKDLWCFLGTGLLSIVFFNICYFTEITITTLSVAAILLYTAPAFVIVLSAICFREKITKRKLAALLLAFLGLMFVTGFIGSAQRLDARVLLIGLGAGLGYALYSIFGRYAIERGYASPTISFYTFLFAGLATVFLAKPLHVAGVLTSSWTNAGFCVLFALVSTVIPYLTYTFGLKAVEGGQASIIASVEPVVATLNGIFFFREKLTAGVLVGAALVLAGIIVSNINTEKHCTDTIKCRRK